MRKMLSVFIVFSAVLVAPSFAQQGDCVTTVLDNIICPPPNGTITTDNLNQVICAPGKCLKNNFGNIVCSAAPGGAIVVDSLGQIKCVGGCVQANASFCQIPE